MTVYRVRREVSNPTILPPTHQYFTQLFQLSILNTYLRFHFLYVFFNIFWNLLAATHRIHTTKVGLHTLLRSLAQYRVWESQCRARLLNSKISTHPSVICSIIHAHTHLSEVQIHQNNRFQQLQRLAKVILNFCVSIIQHWVSLCFTKVWLWDVFCPTHVFSNYN